MRLFTKKRISKTVPKAGEDYGMVDVIPMEDLEGKFQITFGVNIEICGLFVFTKMPHFAATPDGFNGDNAIVKVECPYKMAKMKITRKEAAQRKVVPYLVVRVVQQRFLGEEFLETDLGGEGSLCRAGPPSIKEYERFIYADDDVVSIISILSEDERVISTYSKEPKQELCKTVRLDVPCRKKIEQLPEKVIKSKEINENGIKDEKKPQVTCGVKGTTDGMALQVEPGTGAELELLEPPFEVTFENTGSEIKIDFAKVNNTSTFEAPIV
ncbi:hypothetical protein RN001_005848 [Aquatica leii]|uniref:Uncharacterized protein n=1 Tax=Aquatica leii TaxID=1421715 RepID=A0AAN7Q0Z4_9COLE|nr:hypothetical protein RN001_005848 [Aquatica leii]